MTPTEFKTLFPVFAAVEDSRVLLFLNGTDPYIEPERWEPFTETAIANLAAHELLLATPSLWGAAGGVVSTDGKISKKVGELSTTKSDLAMAAAMKNPYMRTQFGQKFAELRRMAGIGAVSV